MQTATTTTSATAATATAEAAAVAKSCEWQKIWGGKPSAKSKAKPSKSAEHKPYTVRSYSFKCNRLMRRHWKHKCVSTTPDYMLCAYWHFEPYVYARIGLYVFIYTIYYTIYIYMMMILRSRIRTQYIQKLSHIFTIHFIWWSDAYNVHCTIKWCVSAKPSSAIATITGKKRRKGRWSFKWWKRVSKTLVRQTKETKTVLIDEILDFFARNLRFRCILVTYFIFKFLDNSNVKCRFFTLTFIRLYSFSRSFQMIRFILKQTHSLWNVFSPCENKQLLTETFQIFQSLNKRDSL